MADLLDVVACDRCKRSIRDIPSLELESWAVVSATYKMRDEWTGGEIPEDERWYADEFNPDDDANDVMLPRRWTCRCWNFDDCYDTAVPLNDAGQKAMEQLTGYKLHPAVRYYTRTEVAEGAF